MTVNKNEIKKLLRYRINKRDYVISSDGLAFPRPSLLRDHWEDFDQDGLIKYFDKNYAKFLERLHKFKELKRQVNTQEEAELKFMLDALIQAKNNLEE